MEKIMLRNGFSLEESIKLAENLYAKDMRLSRV